MTGFVFKHFGNLSKEKFNSLKPIKFKTNYDNVSYDYFKKMFKEQYKYGFKEFYNEKGKLHNDNGPALITPHDTKAYYKNGKLHRTNGPAIIFSNGIKMWYQNGKCHRDDGPSFTSPYNTEMWHQNDKLHRVDGPALTINDKRVPKRYYHKTIHPTHEPSKKWTGTTHLWTNAI